MQLDQTVNPVGRAVSTIPGKKPFVDDQRFGTIEAKRMCKTNQSHDKDKETFKSARMRKPQKCKETPKKGTILHSGSSGL
jgi:hypothetical protein